MVTNVVHILSLKVAKNKTSNLYEKYAIWRIDKGDEGDYNSSILTDKVRK